MVDFLVGYIGFDRKNTGKVKGGKNKVLTLTNNPNK